MFTQLEFLFPFIAFKGEKFASAKRMTIISVCSRVYKDAYSVKSTVEIGSPMFTILSLFGWQI